MGSREGTLCTLEKGRQAPQGKEPTHPGEKGKDPMHSKEGTLCTLGTHGMGRRPRTPLGPWGGDPAPPGPLQPYL